MCASPAALRRADELYRRLKPHLAEMIERNDPSVENLTFDDIEANSAAVGDLFARGALREAGFLVEVVDRDHGGLPAGFLASSFAISEGCGRCR